MEMEKLVSLCKRRGFLFQSSEIYGGINGFWDYGPLGVELKRNVREAWWRDMVTGHDDSTALPGAPSAFEMVGLDCTIIMHPQVWKCSGHYDLFHDYMVDCKSCNSRYRSDQVMVKVAVTHDGVPFANEAYELDPNTGMGLSNKKNHRLEQAEARHFKGHPREITHRIDVTLEEFRKRSEARIEYAIPDLQPKCPQCNGELTEPREFNLMLETHIGAVRNEASTTFLRPETAQGIFVNFKNVLDSTRVKIPFGVAQIGKAFRNEITPRNFTFRSREFEQMEIEFFCHPDTSRAWYEYWRDRRMKWYVELGLAGERLRLRDHDPDELSHYSTGTGDVEYAFPFLPEGEFGELEGIAHRGDFDLRSHMEGKLDPGTCPLELELGPDGKPKYKGSGRDLTYRDEAAGERYTPHVIEPSAGADRAVLAFLCEAYTEDEAPDDKGNMKLRTVMKLHPRLAPIKAAVFPLVKKDGMPEIAREIYRALKPQFNVFYDEKGAVGRRYRRQDEAGTPFCITVDGQTLDDGTVTIRDRDTLEQRRVKAEDCAAEIAARLRI